MSPPLEQRRSTAQLLLLILTVGITSSRIYPAGKLWPSPKAALH
jgi:hypothetical protein